MRITRINRIKDHRAFADFEWRDLHDFGQFNLIYGWNGSGKTTLSNLLRHLQTQSPILEGQVEFTIDGNAVLGTAIGPTTTLPRVRVFNRDFVSGSISVSSLSPIFFLGPDSVEKQKGIVALKEDIAKLIGKITDNEREKKHADNALDKFCVSNATTIRELLKSSGKNDYNNYDKGSFRKAATAQLNEGQIAHILDEKTKQALKQKKDGTAKELISDFSITIPDLAGIAKNCKNLLKKTVVSQVLPELAADAPLAEWVRLGLSFHTGANTTTRCHFCSSALPTNRLADLEAHFNDAYKKLLEEIDAQIQSIDGIGDEFESITWPAKTEFYNHLADEFLTAKKFVTQEAKAVRIYLDKLKAALSKKRQAPFESLDLNQVIESNQLPDLSPLEQATVSVQAVIQKHNKATEDFASEVKDARQRLEKGLIADAVDEFKKLSQKTSTLRTQATTFSNSQKDLEEKVSALERDIIEHQRPAEELNSELASYLGRDDLHIKVKSSEPGYEITRSGQIANNLSEGERTAIAFLYFLKSLQDKNFTIASDIVVIDDPVSSLDTNSLFCAFGYLKERTKTAGQLFILTHNFNFFRQVRNWFFKLPDQNKKDITKRPARFFMAESSYVNGKRNARLKPIDRLLLEYESEYHYLFKRLHDESKKSPAEQKLEDFYPLPNIARRLLESFLTFRYPNEAGNLHAQLERCSFDSAKRARLLRFLHTYSHDQTIGETGHDLSLLAETPDILRNLMDFIKTEDEKHFLEMEALIKATS
jgi:wobble nucleotide-excising tRNase